MVEKYAVYTVSLTQGRARELVGGVCAGAGIGRAVNDQGDINRLGSLRFACIVTNLYC